MRTVLAVVAGYLVTSLLVFALLTGVYLAAGPGFAFEPGTYRVSVGWALVMIVVGIDAALAGGFVAHRLAPAPRTVRALAAVVVVLGLAMAMSSLNAPEDPALAVRTGAAASPPSSMDAMMRARTPTWAAVLNPVLGVLGVFAGGWLSARRGRARG
jgi:hypothetical protein